MERISRGYGRCLRQESGQSLVWLGHPETRFTFDHVACETISQESLFRVAGLPMVENCLSGYNSCTFAYGQTGSGKTYTMMGEIYEIEGMLTEDCGLTPRIFEYLFTRIMMEEENRRDEQLKYSFKCSFLEIYNEQITDLLEPSSANLQLREDLKKGVYVENLTEYDVRNVNDVIKLLLQGAANRKVAATHVNSESSRSHSVFTCTIESRWGRDSMTHFRFARLNLVDLAGSERQKSSGTEGDRLKEAANINKSLSTLGLVIMSLVDLAHGKHRHVPYRDSRLTFLLQDSLGGNSKTTIIANISPSVCSANETLSTLKFAQRAKLIRNNAKVNEDTSGDVNALQRQIQELKGRLSYLTKHAYLLRSSPSFEPGPRESTFTDLPEEFGFLENKMKTENHVIQHLQNKIKYVEATLVGALRREKLAETACQKLEAELEQISCLAHQREEEAQHAKTIIKLRDKEIKRLESLKDGVLSAEKYLVQENKALMEEIQILQTEMKRIPEFNHYAVENHRLREQLQRFENFYEQGERELLIAEVSELRNQILDMQVGKVPFSTNNESQGSHTTKEFEDCKIMNSKLISEVEELRRELRSNLNRSQTASDSVLDSFSKNSEVFRLIDESSLFDSRSVQSDAGDEMTSCIQTNDEELCSRMNRNVDSAPTISSNVSEEEFMDARLLIEVEESEPALSDTERLSTQENSCRYKEISNNGYMLAEQSAGKLKSRFSKPGDLDMQNNGLVEGTSKEVDGIVLRAKLDRMTKDLEEVRLLNSQFQEEQELQLSCQQEAELVREQVELETARTILQLQEEVASLQCNLDEKLGYMAQENANLRKIVATKDEELKALNMEWERATLELTGFLVDGSRSLRNMSRQIESIACSFPETTISISEHVERAAKTYIEKEETILQLKTSLEDAQSMVVEMGHKLSSLKGVTLALTELQNLNDEISKGHESMLSSDKIDRVQVLEKKLEIKEGQVIEAEKCASVALILITWLFDRKKVAHDEPESREKTMGLRHQPKNSEYFIDDTLSFEAHDHQKFEKHYDVLHHIRDEITKANCRLEAIEDFIRAEVDVFECSSTNGGLLHGDEWSPDCSSSSSDLSVGSVASGIRLDVLSTVIASNQMDLKFEDLMPSSHHRHSASPNTAMRNLSRSEIARNLLKTELESLFDASNMLRSRLATLVNELNSRICSDSEDSKQPIPSSDSTLEKAYVGSLIHKGASYEKIEHARSFLEKFEEVHSTVKEADSMLNALVEANANSKLLSGTWKRAGEELLLERANLYEEIERLKSSISVKENENQLLQDESSCGLQEIASSISLLEECYAQLKNDDKKLTTVFSDVSSLGVEMLKFIRNSRSLLEDICSKIMEKDFSSFVLYQCYLGELTNKLSCQDAEAGFHLIKNVKKPQNSRSNGQNEIMINGTVSIEAGVQREVNNNTSLPNDNLKYENLSLKKELKRKEELLAGLLFDFSLLQESTSNTKDVKDETERLVCTLSKVRCELETKTRQCDEIVVQHKKLESQLVDTEEALDTSNSNLANLNETIEALLEQNTELKVLFKDLYLKKSEVEEQLEEHKEVVKSLEEEILHLSASTEKKFHSLVEEIEDNLIKVTYERDQLKEEVQSLNDKLEMAYAIVDEKEAVIIEAHQEYQATKLYADQKEEEVKILESSIEELESTINVLEKKTYEMDEEVERHRLIRDSLELELKALRHRLFIVENLMEHEGSENANVEDIQSLVSRQLQNQDIDLHQAHVRIKFLEEEKEQHESEIKQYKEYINEIMLHAEAQSSQYQQKYKSLEDMVLEVKIDSTNSTSIVPESDKTEKSTVRTRGSSSPFRCISSLVPQLNLEREQELSAARLRIEELEALAAGRQKEVCLLKTRLASTESMTHDVIRELLGVKLDMNNFANFVDQYQVKKLIEDAHQHTEAFMEKEEEVTSLTKQMNDLIEERERCAMEINKREGELLAAQVDVEQLKERDRLLSAQNEMLKMDKTNLMRKIAELDETVKALLGTKTTQVRTQQASSSKNSLRIGNNDFAKRLEQSEKLLYRVNGELAQYYRSQSDRASGQGLVTNSRKQKGHDG